MAEAAGFSVSSSSNIPRKNGAVFRPLLNLNGLSTKQLTYLLVRRRVDYSKAIEKKDLRAFVRAHYNSIIEIDAALSAKSTEDSAIPVETSTNKSLTGARERMITWKWKLLEKDHMLTRQEVDSMSRNYQRMAEAAPDEASTRIIITDLKAFLMHDRVKWVLNTKAVAPSVPCAPTAIARYTNSLELVWKLAEDDGLPLQLEYEVFFWRGLRAGQTELCRHPRLKICDLLPNTTYSIKVRARNCNGWSIYSDVARITTRKEAASTGDTMPMSATGKVNMQLPKTIFEIMQQVPAGYNALVNGIIRPKRRSYSIADLGKNTFRLGAIPFVREDFCIKNARGLTLHISHWRPSKQAIANAIPMLVYLHGNCGCRMDVSEILKETLVTGKSVVGVDLSGSGMSEGEYISLGWHEHMDVKAVLTHFHRKWTMMRLEHKPKIFLYGRSMGAVTALLYATSKKIPRELRPTAVVCDSPFKDLWHLANELVALTKFNIPGFAMNLARKIMRKACLDRAQLDIDQLSPIAHMPRCRVPVLFGAGTGDNFIDHSHAKALHAAHPGPKQMILFQGDHNSLRPKWFIRCAILFLDRRGPVPLPRGVPET